MAIPVAGAAIKAIAGKAAKQVAPKAPRAKRVSDEVYNARRRARRAKERAESALRWLDNPAGEATRTAKNLAQSFTRQELEKMRRAYQETEESLKQRGGEYTTRQLQQARRENILAENIRQGRAKMSIREEEAWKRLGRSESSRDVAWSYVNKKLSKEAGGRPGRKATVEDLRRIGGSDDVEQAIENIFEREFGMSIEEAESYDAINRGNEELYKELQFTIVTGKPKSEQTYAEKSETGYYEGKRVLEANPKRKRVLEANAKRKLKGRKSKRKRGKHGKHGRR